MPSSDWRSPAAYGHAQSIPAAGFAWEYLRRDDQYRRDFQHLMRKPDQDAETRTAFSNRWGLRFRGRPGSARRSGVAVLDTRAPA